MSILDIDILSVLIFLPFVGVILLIGINGEKHTVIKGITFITAGLMSMGFMAFSGIQL